MFRVPAGVAVPTVLPRLLVPSVHPPVFGLSNCSVLCSDSSVDVV